MTDFALAPLARAPERLPQAAEAVFARWLAGDPTEPLPEHVRAAAQRALPRFQAACAPAAPEDWHGFLRPLAAAVRNPPGDDALRGFAAVCATSLDTIPEALLTPERQREAMRRFAFWPAIADLAEWLEPDASRARAELATVRRMANAPAVAAPAAAAEPPPPGWCPRAAADAAIADLRAIGREKADAEPPKPRHLGLAERVLAFRAAGQPNTAAAIERHHGIRVADDGTVEAAP